MESGQDSMSVMHVRVVTKVCTAKGRRYSAVWGSSMRRKRNERVESVGWNSVDSDAIWG